jgi:hypothetical protein
VYSQSPSCRLDEAKERENKVIQQREHLRHALIKMRMSMRGSGDDSTAGIVKRISQDSQKLANIYGKLLAKYTQLASDNERLHKTHATTGTHVQSAAEDLANFSTEYDRLTRTFETFLQSRLERTHQERRWKAIPSAVSASVVSSAPQMPLGASGSTASMRLGPIREASSQSLLGIPSLSREPLHAGRGGVSESAPVLGASKGVERPHVPRYTLDDHAREILARRAGLDSPSASPQTPLSPATRRRLLPGTGAVSTASLPGGRLEPLMGATKPERKRPLLSTSSGATTQMELGSTSRVPTQMAAPGTDVASTTDMGQLMPKEVRERVLALEQRAELERGRLLLRHFRTTSQSLMSGAMKRQAVSLHRDSSQPATPTAPP